MSAILRLLTLVLCVSATGCALDFDEPHDVNKLRVLGVQAEPPEIAPGDGTSVSVLWADPLGEDRDVEFVWWFCGGFVFGADLETCYQLIPPIRMSASEGGDRLEIPTIPDDIFDSADLPEGMDYFVVTAVGLMCADGRLPDDDVLADPEGYEHIDDLCEGGEAVSFFRTVMISESDNPQANPGIEGVLFKDEPLPDVESGEVTTLRCKEKDGCDLDVPLSLFMTEGSYQTYEVVEFDEVVEKKDTLFVSWYVTGGAFKDGYRSMVDSEASDDPLGPFETVWQPEEPGEYTLYAVAHDVRGGVSWTSFAFEIEPAR